MPSVTITLFESSSKDPKKAWWSKSLTDIDTLIRNNVPNNALITSARIRVRSDFDGTLATNSAKVYLRFGFGYEGSVSTQLMGDTRIYREAAHYPSDTGVEIKSYFSSLLSPFAINKANYGSNFVCYIHTENVLVNKLIIGYAQLLVDYEIPSYTITFKNHDGTTLQTVPVQRGTTPSYTGSTPTKSQDAQYTYTFSGWSPTVTAATGAQTYTAQFSKTIRSYTISAVASPVAGGTVTGSGTYNYTTSATVTLSATAGADYEFLRWNDGVTSNSRTISVTGDKSYIAYFRLNKIYVNTSRLAGILVDTAAATEVYKDTTKVFG